MHATTCVSLVPVNFAGDVSQLFDVVNEKEYYIFMPSYFYVTL